MQLSGGPFSYNRFDEFDLDQSGRLDQQELKSLMTALNDGVECTDKEVAWVLKAGSCTKNGGRAAPHNLLKRT